MIMPVHFASHGNDQFTLFLLSYLISPWQMLREEYKRKRIEEY